MNSLKKDYKKLYQFQDKFLNWWKTLNLPFYLTGGTALGRYYLNHRYSEDLDFFVNADLNYTEYMKVIRKKISSAFRINFDNALFTEDYTRLILIENNEILKVEFINDVEYRSGETKKIDFGYIDTPFNIISNKLTAIVGRDEPKDIFDILTLALNYNFNWVNIFKEAKLKSIINEIDVEERLINFPMEWLENADWIFDPVNTDSFKKSLKQLANDFLLGRENSLCRTESIHIEHASLIAP